MPGYYPGAYNVDVIPIDRPAAPSNLVATPFSSTQIDLTWTDNSDNETSFSIERGGVEITTVSPGTVSYSDTGLVPETEYSYQVRAFNNAIHSARSNIATATTSSEPFETTFSPSAVFEVPDIGSVWSNLNELLTSDDTYATSSPDGFTGTNPIRCKFDFSSLSGTITGLVFKLEGKAEVGSVSGGFSLSTVFLSEGNMFDGGTITGAITYGGEILLTESDDVYPLGTTIDSWGVEYTLPTLTLADLQSPNFEITFTGPTNNCFPGETKIVSLDNVTVTVSGVI